MTIKEAEGFYNTDTMQYDFHCRNDFQTWFNKKYDDGHSSYLNIEGLNNLVNKIVSWYEFKFPNIELNKPECIQTKFENTPDISKYMDNEQLRYRLSHDERETMDCNYRTSSIGLDNDGNWCSNISLSKNGEEILDISIYTDGKLSSSTKNKYKIPVNTIEEFYELLSFSDEFDLKGIKRAIELHQLDLMLRNFIIDAVRNGLLYSNKTIPENGKIRMEKFTMDMYEIYPNIVLDAKCDEKVFEFELELIKNIPKGFILALGGRGKNEKSCNFWKH